VAGEADYYTTTGLARLFGVSRSTIARLIDHGRIPARKAGSHRRIFKADLEAAGLLGAVAEAPARRQRARSKDEVLRLASDIKDAAARHGARNVRLFGSVLRGQTDERSDVDLLVDLDAGRSLIDLVQLELELEQLLESRVDLGTAVSLRTKVKDRVLAEAVQL
jgi:excisionase family DNA binding protein